MTVALNDVVVLRDLLEKVNDFSDWKEMSRILHRWHWRRKPLASTINILSVALYDLFGADGTSWISVFEAAYTEPCFLSDEALEILRTGCSKYFEMGGECINGPVSLLSGYVPAFHSHSSPFQPLILTDTSPLQNRRRPLPPLPPLFRRRVLLHLGDVHPRATRPHGRIRQASHGSSERGGVPAYDG